jgi:phosphatidylserine/phosphatidylglycerophosphate/cardiolipin synthase-like enzyme
MHNKFAVFDNQVTWTGSANFSNSDFSRNGNNVVVITDTIVATIYRTEFAEMFGGAFSNDKTDNTAHSATVGGIPVEIAFSPTAGVEQRIIAAINSANSSIQVAMFTFTSAPIAQALISARSRGVAVEVLLETVSAGSQFSQRDPLCAAGVTVRVEDFAGRLHDKYAIVDAGRTSDPLIITGSTNWTTSAVEANDENLLIAHDGGLASTFASDFARLRVAISPNAFMCNGGPTAFARVLSVFQYLRGVAEFVSTAITWTMLRYHSSLCQTRRIIFCSNSANLFESSVVIAS